MRTFLVLAALTTATSTFAAELPLNAVYGTPEACENYAIGGFEGVTGNSSDEDNYALVTNTQIISFEWGCDFNGTTLGHVSMTCGTEEGPDPELAWAEVSLDGDALTLKTEYQTVKLNRCPATSEPATM